MIDEFEKSFARKKIIETLRIATKGGVMPKATADHNSVLFEIKHLVWFTGINRGEAKVAADNNRVILIDLLAPTPEQRKRGQNFPPDEELRELGHKAIAVAIAYSQPMLKMEAALSRLSIDGVAHRLVECFAVPAAVSAAVMDYDVKGAKRMLTEMLLARGDDVKQIAHADESRMLEFILRQPIRVSGSEYPLMLLAMDKLPLTNAGSEMTARDYAGMNGVRMVNGGDWFFHEDTITSRDWWKNSDYRGIGIKQALRELIPVSKLHKGNLTDTVELFTGAGTSRAVRVPREVMAQYISEHQLELFGEDGDDEDE